MMNDARDSWSSLRQPDAVGWQILPHYSSDLAGHLQRTYTLLHIAGRTPHPTEYRWEAFRALLPFRDRRLCLPQRLRLEYALALIYTGEQALRQALVCVGEGLEVADQLDDLAAQVELLYLAGAVLELLDENGDALDAYGLALDTLRSLSRDGFPVDASYELDLELRRAWRAWDLGQLSLSLRGLHDAHTLYDYWVPLNPTDPARTTRMAHIAWLEAQMARVRGHLGRAVTHANTAADLLRAQDRQTNTGRIQIIRAECAMDGVEALRTANDASYPASATPYPHSDFVSLLREDPDELLADALSAAQQGLTLARENHDMAGVGMARLALRRARRLRGSAVTPAAIADIEQVARVARRRGDMATAGRAQTALGDELLALGRTEAAALWYYRARMTLQEHGFGGLALWPSAALALHWG